MMRVLVLLLACLAGRVVADPVPECGIGPWAMCRYIDADGERPLTEVVFQRAEGFFDGRAAVEVDGRYGYVDRAGRAVIPPQFQQVAPYRHGLAEVATGRGISLIDRQGTRLATLNARRAIPVSSRVVMAYVDDAVAAASYPGHPVPAELWRGPHEEPVYVYTKAALYSLDSGWIETPPLRSVLPIPGAQNTFWFQIAEAGPGWDLYDWGLMRDDGQWVIPPGIMDIYPLSDGLTLIFDPPDGKREVHDSYLGWELEVNHGGWQAVVDDQGRMIGSGMFADVGVAEDGRPLVFKGGAWLRIDRAGRLTPFDGTPVDLRFAKQQRRSPAIVMDASGKAVRDLRQWRAAVQPAPTGDAHDPRRGLSL